MFVFAHMGIGRKISNPWIKGLPLAPFFVGTLLPDLIDKPLYYGLAWATGKWAAEIGLISGTRTFGHTAFLAAMLFGLATYRKSVHAKALAIGALSHVALDAFLGLMSGFDQPPSALIAFLWPLLGPFPVHPFRNSYEHLSTIQNALILFSEALGAAFLAYDYVLLRRRRNGS